MRFANGWVLALGLVACAESSLPCERDGQAFEASEARFCLYSSDSPLVIEGGFECPEQLPFRFDTDAGVACSERDLDRLPQSVCEQLGAECQDGARPALPHEPSGEPSRPGGASSTDDPWRAVAEERGFLGSTMDKDFFEIMGYACIVDLAGRFPATVQQLALESDRVVLASIAEIVVDPELPPPPEAIYTEEVYLRLEVEETVKGDGASTLLVYDTCGSGGLVFPLREHLPAESFVFFLEAPMVTNAGTEVLGLKYHYLGIVREDENGVRFALPVDETYGPSPPLSDFDSLQSLLDAARAVGSP